MKALKEFRVYILHSHSIISVPSVAIKDILTQAEPDGRRSKWIATLLEYDLKIRPTKLVKGKGLKKSRIPAQRSRLQNEETNLLQALISRERRENTSQNFHSINE